MIQGIRSDNKGVRQADTRDIGTVRAWSSQAGKVKGIYIFSRQVPIGGPQCEGGSEDRVSCFNIIYMDLASRIINPQCAVRQCEYPVKILCSKFGASNPVPGGLVDQ